MDFLCIFLHWTACLASGLIVSSLLFTLDGGLKIIGLMGQPLLALTVLDISNTCSIRDKDGEPHPTAFPLA